MREFGKNGIKTSASNGNRRFGKGKLIDPNADNSIATNLKSAEELAAENKSEAQKKADIIHGQTKPPITKTTQIIRKDKPTPEAPKEEEVEDTPPKKIDSTQHTSGGLADQVQHSSMMEFTDEEESDEKKTIDVISDMTKITDLDLKNRFFMQAIQTLYPDIVIGVDYLLRDDGEGPYIYKWAYRDTDAPEARTVDDMILAISKVPLYNESQIKKTHIAIDACVEDLLSRGFNGYGRYIRFSELETLKAVFEYWTNDEIKTQTIGVTYVLPSNVHEILREEVNYKNLGQIVAAGMRTKADILSNASQMKYHCESGVFEHSILMDIEKAPVKYFEKSVISQIKTM